MKSLIIPIRQSLPQGIPTHCTYPTDISNSSHHFINAILLKLVIRSIARFNLDLSAFSFLTDKLDPNWSIRVGHLTQLQMNWKEITKGIFNLGLCLWEAQVKNRLNAILRAIA